MLLASRNCLAGKTGGHSNRTLGNKKSAKIQKSSWGAIPVVSFFLFVLFSSLELL